MDEAFNAVRALARLGRKEATYAIYATGTDGQLKGVLSLRELLAAAPGAKIAEVVHTEVVSVTPQTDRQEVARITANYDLIAVPVVSESGHLMGVVTVDDIIDVIEEEQTEDVQKMGGMEALDEPYTTISFWAMIRKRGGWLTALFLGEMLTATAMGHFEGEIARVTLLALFVPLIISSGGNSGSQATSLIIRALALRELKLTDWWKVALRELPSGLALGTMLGAVGIVRILVWQSLGWYDYGQHYWLIAITVGISLIGVVTFGTLAGSMLPFLLKRLDLTPRARRRRSWQRSWTSPDSSSISPSRC